jgi:hypothetical protein
MDALLEDDIRSARETTPAERLARALRMMEQGLALKRAQLQRRFPDDPARAQELYERWLFKLDD